MKILSPYQDYKYKPGERMFNSSKRIVAARLSLYHMFGNAYIYFSPNHSQYLFYRYQSDLKTTRNPVFESLTDAKEALDIYLISSGYEFVSWERFEKLRLLI